MVNSSRSWFPILGLLAMAGCADQPQEMEESAAEAPAMAPAGPSVSITQPADGTTVTGPNVMIALSTEGLMIMPAGTMEAGTGHHHIFLDVDVSPMGEVIPAGVPGIIHLGMAQTVHVIEGVSPGPHRLIAVVGDGAHIPLNPPVVDTINITVTAGN